MVVPQLGIRSPPSLRSVQRAARTVRSSLPPLNFITIHYAYFVATCLISALIFWGASTPARSVSFTDSIFLATSAMTLAGLNTVNLSTLNTFQQFMLFILIMIGSAIFVSAFVVHVRLRAFERRFQSVVASQRGDDVREKPVHLQSGHPRESNVGPEGDRSEKGEKAPALDLASPERIRSEMRIQRGRSNSCAIVDEPEDEAQAGPSSLSTARGTTSGTDHISFTPETIFRIPTHDLVHPEAHHHRHHHRILSMQGVGAHPGASIHRRSGSHPAINLPPPLPDGESTGQGSKNFLTRAVSRNSSFHHLTEEERHKLGGVEYKAVQFLAIIVPLYFVLFQLLGCLALGAYVAYNRPSTARENGLNPWWVGAFNAVSAFNNSGMSLLDANMVAFQTSIYMLLTMGLLILAGNTMYPVFLRLIVWTFYHLLPDSPRWDDYRTTLKFLLDHPRRCYTNLFPARHTWWLLASVIVLNGTDWVAFEVLNIGNNKIRSLPTGIYIIDGLFQALAVRSGGFYVVSIPDVRISLQILYVVMMYISVYPVVISMRNSNVYEERSLGIYAGDPPPTYNYHDYFPSSSSDTTSGKNRNILRRITRRFSHHGSHGADPHEHATTAYFVRHQLRAQLAHDLWWIVLAVFVIAIIETSQFERDPAHFSVFNVVFETVSAYGCVGISVGIPDNSYSFCGSWHKLSKLVLCAVMIRGRHRGLPVAIDKAVLLPGEALERAEEEDAWRRAEGRLSVSRGGERGGEMV